MRVILSRPKDYDEATSICDELKNRKIVVVNVSDLEPKVAQRLLDFMGGASYVLNGELQEIEKNVYILSPSNVEVSNELKTEMTGKGMFAWTK
jgi:cell division inhibitor SepF